MQLYYIVLILQTGQSWKVSCKEEVQETLTGVFLRKPMSLSILPCPPSLQYRSYHCPTPLPVPTSFGSMTHRGWHLPVRREGHAATEVGGRIVVFAGFCQDQEVRTLDPEDEKGWEVCSAASLSDARCGVAERQSCCVVL